MVHNYVPKDILIAKIIPLVKDPNGDICSAENYRSISLSSIFLKILDRIMILLYGEKLKSDDLQFGFQKWSGTEVCTRTLLESIDYYLQRGSKAYVVFMDCSKAFDKVIHSKLFGKIFAADVHPLYIRMMIFIYRNQSGKVSWDGYESAEFPIKNGVRQGAVLSPVLFNMYTTELFNILDKLGCGARIRGIFFGLFGYADDLALMSNTVEGLQKMLDETAEYARAHNINFSTNEIIEKSKTKSMVFGGRKGNVPEKSMMLNDKPLPWVKRVKYLGTIITNDHDKLKEDVGSKRAKFIDNANSLLQEFRSAHPCIKSQINMIYNGSVYGGNLYELEGTMCKQLFNSFNVSIRTIWELPRQTHRYIVGELAGGHMMSNMISNKINFYRRLESSHKVPVRLLFKLAARDLRTTTGKSLKLIQNVGIDLGLIGFDSDVLCIDVKRFKSLHRQVSIPEDEKYRLGVLSDLLGLRTQFKYFKDDQFVIEDIEDMIEDICVK